MPTSASKELDISQTNFVCVYKKRLFLFLLGLSFLLFFVFHWLYTPFVRVEANSMFPALQHGDLLLVNLYVYRFSEPGRGDIAVFKHRNSLFVKRIIGLPGDTVEVIEHRAIVNGVLLEEQYLQLSTISKTWPVFMQASSSYGPVKVAPGSYFFLGDNRPQSMDSRRWGVISKDSIVGRVDAAWLPWGRASKMEKI